MPRPTLPTDPDDPRYRELVSRFLAGDTQAAIAVDYGVTQPSVSSWILAREYRRDRGLAERLKWGRMTDEQRARQVAAAHDARRGSNASADELANRAAAVEAAGQMTGDERFLAGLLDGFDVVPQRAVCGRYNVDLAVGGTVAVELFGGGWHAHGRHGARLLDRTERILRDGWNLYIIWTHHRAHRLGPDVADDLVAFCKRAGDDPAVRGEYRVVWGDGQWIASGHVDDDDLTLVPSGRRSDYAQRA